MCLRCKEIRFANVECIWYDNTLLTRHPGHVFDMEKGRQKSLQGQKAKRENSFCCGSLIYECATPDSIGYGIVMAV